MARKKEKSSEDKNKIMDKRIGFFDVISKNELLWRVVWGVAFSLILGELANALVHAFGDGEVVSARPVSVVVFIETGLVVLAISAFAIVSKYIKAMKTMIAEGNEMIENVAGGTMVHYFDDNFTIKNVTPMFYKIVKYEKGEIAQKLHREFSRLLVGEESKREFARQKRLLREKGTAEAQYKIHCGDGSDIWVSSRSYLTKNKNLEHVVYTVLFDISREMETKEKLLLAEARNKLVLENINSGIFELDMFNNTIELSEQLMSRFAASSNIVSIAEFEKVAAHSDDTELIKNAIDALRSGFKDNLEVTLRLLEKDGSYKYSSVNMKLIRDNNKVAARAVGIVMDVDDNVKKEQLLRHRAARDSLTGIYNRGATQKLIESTLELRGDQEHALILCDIDDFKSVNDTFGHGIGDEAIKTVANLLSSVFDYDSVVGRIGGDEFVVLCRNINGDYEGLKEKLERFKTEDPHVEAGGRVRKITLSVGVAIYPQDADTYEGLYKNADVALYEAKKAGKNRYVFRGDFREDA